MPSLQPDEVLHAASVAIAQQAHTMAKLRRDLDVERKRRAEIWRERNALVAERDAMDALVAAVKALAVRLDGFAESTISVADSELYSTLAAEIRKAVEVDHG